MLLPAPQSTVAVALLQPSPDTLALADDIMLLSAGRLVFQGPYEMALPFFEQCGFACPPQKPLAGFLQEVTTPTGQQVRSSWPGNLASPMCSLLLPAVLKTLNLTAPCAAPFPLSLQRFWQGDPAGHKFVSARELEEAFWAQPAGTALQRELQQPAEPPDKIAARCLETRRYASKSSSCSALRGAALAWL